MKRLSVGLLLGAIVSVGAAVIAGFVPRGTCGSFFSPSRGVPDTFPGVTNPYWWCDVQIENRLNGYAIVFWIFAGLAFALLIGAVVFWQIRAHRMSALPHPQGGSKASAGANGGPVQAEPATVSGRSDLVDQLRQLSALHSAGELSDNEYAAAKARLIGP